MILVYLSNPFVILKWPYLIIVLLGTVMASFSPFVFNVMFDFAFVYLALRIHFTACKSVHKSLLEMESERGRGRKLRKKIKRERERGRGESISGIWSGNCCKKTILLSPVCSSVRSSRDSALGQSSKRIKNYKKKLILYFLIPVKMTNNYND